MVWTAEMEIQVYRRTRNWITTKELLFVSFLILKTTLYINFLVKVNINSIESYFKYIYNLYIYLYYIYIYIYRVFDQNCIQSNGLDVRTYEKFAQKLQKMLKIITEDNRWEPMGSQRRVRFYVCLHCFSLNVIYIWVLIK